MAAAGFTIPNETDAGHAHQARVFESDIDILVAGLAGDGVVSGCAVSDNATGLQVDVASGSVKIGGTEVTVASGTVTPGAADGTNPRFDLVVVNNAGTKSVTAGTAASSPKLPAVPANSVALAALYIRAGATTLASADIVDKRVILPTPSHSLLNEAHATTTIANTTTETDLYSFALPTNLAAGDILRLSLRGDYLNNTGSGQGLTIKVKIGATTAITLASSGTQFGTGTDRRDWHADVLIACEGTAAQRVYTSVVVGMNTAAAINAGSTFAMGNETGSATEDTTSAKTLAVTATLTTASANLEVTAKIAVLEKIT